MAWLGVLLVVLAASIGKIGGTAVGARITGTQSWRECLVLGIFMNCKGYAYIRGGNSAFLRLVEIIILNIGLDAGVLNETTFAIMVLLALITTFATTPLALWVYPQHKRGTLQEQVFVSLELETDQTSEMLETQPLMPASITNRLSLDMSDKYLHTH